MRECMNVCVCVSILGGWGGAMSDEEFVYISIVCFDVSCFLLSMKCMWLGLS